MWFIKGSIGFKKRRISEFFCEMFTCINKQTNTLSPSQSPKCFQSPSPRTSEKSADSDLDVRKALPGATSGGTRRDPTRPDKSRRDPTSPDETRQDPTRPNETRRDPMRPDKTRRDPTRPDETRRDPTRPDETRRDPTRPSPRPSQFQKKKSSL
jgi:hypothetical protein